jgi:hypothetical protein
LPNQQTWIAIIAPQGSDTVQGTVLGLECYGTGAPLRVNVLVRGRLLGIPESAIPRVTRMRPDAREAILFAPSGDPFVWGTRGERALSLMPWRESQDSLTAWEAIARADSIRAAQDRATAEKARAKASAEAEAAAEKDRVARLATRRAAYKKKGWSTDVIDAIISRKIMIGMTPDMVREAWGDPEHINRTITAEGTREQWVYGLGTYVYFDRGRLSTIQDSRSP